MSDFGPSSPLKQQSNALTGESMNQGISVEVEQHSIATERDAIAMSLVDATLTIMSDAKARCKEHVAE